MAIQIGQLAPDFTLFSDEKKSIQLSDYKGKNVVLLFFPQAFTGTCTAELCEMRDNLAKYEALNAQIVGISVDSVFTLAEYKASQSYNFPLLSDFNKEVSTAYDTIYEVFPAFGMKGVSKRSAFVVDKEGIIRHTEVLENPGDMPNFKALNDLLATLN